MTSFPINIEEGVSDDFIPDGFVRPSFLPLASFDDLYASEIPVVDGDVKAVERRVAVDCCVYSLHVRCQLPSGVRLVRVRHERLRPLVA